MKTLLSLSLRRSLALGSLLAALATAPLGVRAAQPLSDDDVKFLTLYEQVMKGLVTDNLDIAKDAAKALPAGDGADLVNAKDLKGAREAFAVLSNRAEKIVVGQPDFHVYHCPMVNKDWVQRSTTPTAGATAIANPYMGKEMLTCGVEKK